MSVIYWCVTNHPKLGHIKQQLFYFAHGFYGTQIWLKHRWDGLTLFYNIWGFTREDSNGWGQKLSGTLHSYAWSLDRDDLKAELSWDCWLEYPGFSISHGLNRSMAASVQLDFLCDCSELWELMPHWMRRKMYGLLWSSLGHQAGFWFWSTHVLPGFKGEEA